VKAASKVILNTGILYGRMLLTMGISLYTTRLILNALGQTDYGVFNLIAGVIAMLSFLNTAMATSTQRYLSFHQGKGDIAMQELVFGNSVLLHVVIGLLVVFGLEIAGFFLLDGFLKIPIARLEAAKTVYHYMSATVFFTIVAVPFLGSLTAHENMLWVAIVAVTETILKLGIASFLFITTNDKLVIYGLLTASISVFTCILYAVYCLKKYPECQLRNINLLNRKIVKELTSFAGWNLFGSLCSVGRAQGIAILLNLTFGTIVNAAYGIANQVSAQLTFFSATMLRALNPQIMKSEGANDRQRMLRLSMMASKFGFFLLAFIAIPCIFEMPGILRFWLKTVPENTVIFCQLIQITIGLQSAIQAIGNIKAYQTVVGSVILLNLPIAYVLLNTGFPSHYVLVSYILIECVACILRLHFLVKIANLGLKDFAERVIIKVVPPTLFCIGACLAVVNLGESQYRFIYTSIISSIAYVACIYMLGLCADEKDLISGISRKVYQKFPALKILETKAS
jgi:O-antigen/teichoic acid export membrane protein